MNLSTTLNDILKPISTDIILSLDPELFFGFLLLEDSFHLLLEDGFRLKLE